MSTQTIDGFTFRVPSRIGCTMRATLATIMQGPPMALYAAMGLRGRAKSYESRYRASFARFAQANPELLQPGAVGPRGGFGYRFNGGNVK